MDPIVQAAAITAGARILTTLIEAWKASKPEDKTQKKVNNWLTKKYNSLHEAVSPNSVKLLYAIENGQRRRVGDLIKVIYPRRKFPAKYAHVIKNELEYRLRYLAAIGLIRSVPTIKRYQITRLGVAFLSKARVRKHYSDVLLRSAPRV